MEFFCLDIFGTNNVPVDSVNEHGIFLEVVQILNDLNITFTKVYISSDRGWFMNDILS